MTQEELDALMAGDLEGVAAETDDAQASDDENLNLESILKYAVASASSDGWSQDGSSARRRHEG